jgi:hypothetical protein
MMRIAAFCAAILACVGIGHPSRAEAQVDQQRAQEYFKEAQALCERDGGRLWGVSICAPMVIGDARTETFATSQRPPDAPRPNLIGLVNGPIQWGDTRQSLRVTEAPTSARPKNSASSSGRHGSPSYVSDSSTARCS